MQQVALRAFPGDLLWTAPLRRGFFLNSPARIVPGLSTDPRDVRMGTGQRAWPPVTQLN